MHLASSSSYGNRKSNVQHRPLAARTKQVLVVVKYLLLPHLVNALMAARKMPARDENDVRGIDPANYTSLALLPRSKHQATVLLSAKDFHSQGAEPRDQHGRAFCVLKSLPSLFQFLEDDVDKDHKSHEE